MGRLAFLQEWSSHAVFGDTFRSTLDKIIEEFGEAPSAQEVKQEESEAGNPKKRKGRDETQATVAKCPRSAVPVKQIPIQSIGSEQVLLETELVNCKNKGLKLQMKAGGKVYVLNTSSTAAKLPAGLVLAGFGKGSYKQRAAGEPVGEKEVLFTLQPETMVLMGNTLKSVRSVVDGKRSTDPHAKVAYHEMSEASTTEDPSKFDLKLTTRIVFVPTGPAKAKEEEGEGFSGAQVSAARMVPMEAWVKGSLAFPAWCVRWAPQGLMPIRPVIVLLQEIMLEPAHGVML